ncbi:MAG: threonine/serine dehydratase [Candidatus Dormibacteria bacterium]
MSASQDPSSIDLGAARQRIRDWVHQTPLLHSSALDRRAGLRLWLKAETFQRSGSFKARGAFNALAAGLEAGDRRGVIAVSSGNHGQAVALAASELGLGATVVMPQDASEVKVAAVRAYGANVVNQGVTGENREEVATQLAADHDLRLVHPHDDPLVIAGQATVGTELLDQCQRVGVRPRVVLVPVGGGGLLAGICLALEDRLPGVTVIGVEPALGNDGQQSLAEGRLVSLARPPDTAADGARTLHLGGLCWDVIRSRVSRIVTVTDEEIAHACWWLWSRCKLVVEPTGAMTVAAALRGPGDLGPAGLSSIAEGDPAEVVCILSGGNCTPRQIADLLVSSATGLS